jgi:hypothetical protein
MKITFHAALLVLALAGQAAPAVSPRPGLSLVRLEVDANDRDIGRVVRGMLWDRLPAVCLESGRYRLPARTDPQLYRQLQNELKFQARMVDPAQARALGRMAGIGVFMVASGHNFRGVAFIVFIYAGQQVECNKFSGFIHFHSRLA